MGVPGTTNMAEVAVIASVQETGLVAFIAFYRELLACCAGDRLLTVLLCRLLPHLQLLRCCFHPMRGRRGCRQPKQVQPRDLRLLPNWPRFQRCLPLHGLAPDRASAADRDRPCDEAVP